MIKGLSIIIATAALALVALSGTANASGWQEYFDCRNGVVSVIIGWKAKMWLSVEKNHKSIFESGKFFDAGLDTLDKPPRPLNANAADFRFRVKLNGRAAIVHFHRDPNGDEDKVIFAGRSCRFMGDGYADELKKYNGDDE
jgi:hypothetical protein